MAKAGSAAHEGAERSRPASLDERRAYWLAWKHVEVRGRPAAYGEAGTGTPVVFLHGWGLDHRVYKRALARLAAAGVRVVAPALPGFGGTAALRERSWSLSGFADWLTEFLDAVGVSEPSLVVGHSFGGGVGIVFAHDHPARVRGLVLVNSIGASAWSGTRGAARRMAQRPLWDWGLHFPSDLWPLGQTRRVLPVILAEAVPNLVRDPRAFWRVAALARTAYLTGELEELKARRLPVVVLWGRQDRIITRDAFEEMCAVLGDPHSFTVEGSHAWLIADPDTFGEIMTNVVDIATRTSALGPAGAPVRELPTLSNRAARARPVPGQAAG